MFFTYLRRELRGRMRQAVLIALGLALGVGLLVVILGQMIRFQIPFIFMLILVALAYISLERLWNYQHFK